MNLGTILCFTSEFMTRLDINRKQSNGDIAAKAPMSPVAIVLCIVVSCTASLHRTPGRCGSLLSTITQRHPSGRRQPSRCACCTVVLWPHVQLSHEAHLTSRNSPIADSSHLPVRSNVTSVSSTRGPASNVFTAKSLLASNKTSHPTQNRQLNTSPAKMFSNSAWMDRACLRAQYGSTAN